jgi:hypothetical protein
MRTRSETSAGHDAFSVFPGGQGQLCPDLLTEEETVRFLRLDVNGPSDPQKTLRYYRERGLLKATRAGKRLHYQRKELLNFLDKLTERTEKHT